MAGSGDDGYKWVSVTDFTPGIRQKLGRAYYSVTTSPSTAPGAATTNTYRCIALKSGGLGPLPRLINTVSIPARDAVSGAGLKFGCYMLVGVYVQGNVNAGTNPAAISLDNLFLAIEWVNLTGTITRRFQLLRYRLFTPPLIDTIDDISDTNAIAATDPGWVPCLMNTLRAHPTTATLPGTPGMVYTWISGAGEAAGVIGAQWKMFPSPTTPTALTPATISNTVGVVGTVSSVHQERAISLGPVNYANGAAVSSIAFQLNEQFFFTAANLLTGLNAIANVFEGQTSTGISFVQSMSADQLFVNKSSGGSYMIRGDIANPTVYRLPGVPSSKVVQTPAPTQVGLFYCVLNGGLWTWGGGSSATCVSEQLEDNFWGPIGGGTPHFSVASSTQGAFIPYNNQLPYYPFYNPFAGRLQHHNDWVMIPNNWLYDIPTQSFWRMDNPADFPTTPIMHWNKSMANDYIIGSPLYYLDATTPVAYVYDPQVGATSYRWQSQPMPQTTNTISDFKEVILVAQGTGTVTVTLTAKDPATGLVINSQPKTFTFTDATYPQTFRANLGRVPSGAFQGTHLQVQLDAASTGPTISAPIIHEYRIGMRDRTHVASR